MFRSFRNRKVLLGTLLGSTVTIAVILSFGVMAGAGEAASAAAPVNTGPPTITGTAQEGHTLVGHRGQWNGSPTDYNDFWMRCNAKGGSCSDISGATNRNGYLLEKLDVGNTNRFKVQAKNADGSTFATSVPTAVVAAGTKPPPPPATGCQAGSGPIPIASLTPPARLLVDGQQSSPSVVSRGTQQVILRYHVSACGGRPVQGALVYATAVPFNQFNVPAEQPTGSDGWAELNFQTLAGFPASPNQGLIAVFVRARKSGEDLLGGISTRRLYSVPVKL